MSESARRRQAWKRSPHGDQRGQALIVAVLVLFAVATLAALFTAIISSQVAQTGRHADVVQLRNVAEAGLRWANEQLTYGIDGADWRPSQKTYRTGGGEVTIDVSYGPSPTRLQSRFVRIVASAVFPDNPFLRHTILGLKPLLLTDYARFITDRYEMNEPAALGVAGVELGGSPRQGGNGGPYLFQITGPIRSNTDLAFYGDSRINLYTRNYSVMMDTWELLGMLRDDTIEVSGEMYSKDRDSTGVSLSRLALYVDGQLRTDDVFNVRSANPTDGDKLDYQNGYPDAYRADGSPVPNTWRVLANLPSYTPAMSTQLRPHYLAAPRIRPPLIDTTHPDLQTNRYLALTRDSGDWLQSSAATPGTVYFMNTGRYGWGWTNKNGGIFIDNAADVQYRNADGTHDLEKLREDWVGSVGVHHNATSSSMGDERDITDTTLKAVPTGPADWWDKTGCYYSPPGVEIILHGDAACPWIEFIRDDAKAIDATVGVDWSNPNTYYFWRRSQGTPIVASTPAASAYSGLGGTCKAPLMNPPPQAYGNWAAMPFPPNGVIYAEGNVRIRGIMPPARYEPTTYADFDRYTASIGTPRKFDLQVVSGGTIYIEGDLLTPGPDGARLSRFNKYGSTDRITTLEMDRLWGSRIALLARDYVCLNTTALLPRPVNATQPLVVTKADGTTKVTTWYNDAQPLYPADDVTYPPSTFTRVPLWQGASKGDPPTEEYDGTKPVETAPLSAVLRYNNIRLQVPDLKGNIADLCLFLGHAGWYAPDYTAPGTGTARPLDSDAANVKVTLAVNESVTPWVWGEGTDHYTFARAAGTDQSAFWYDIVNGPNRLEFLPSAPSPGTQTMFMWSQPAGANAGLTGRDEITLTPTVYPVTQTDSDGNITWVVKPEWLGYMLGPVAIAPPRWVTKSDGTPDVGNPTIPMTVDVQALIYAQNGSWFIIPGPWFSEDSGYAAAHPNWDTEYPGYHEPLSIRLQFLGAISENMPAPIGDVADWTSRWSGTKQYGETYGSNSLQYYYDPLLRVARVRRDPLRPYDATALIGTPRFKSLPLTPDLVVWGERISGQAGG